MSVSKDERERAIFRSRRMYRSDQESNIATAEYRKTLAIARNFLEMDMSIEQIARGTGLTVEEVENLRANL